MKDRVNLLRMNTGREGTTCTVERNQECVQVEPARHATLER